jgi:hypothetical protein
MTPTDTRKRDASAEAYARELTKDRTWFDGNDEQIAIVAHKAGYDAALAECAGEIIALLSKGWPAADIIKREQERDAWREQCGKLAKALELACGQIIGNIEGHYFLMGKEYLAKDAQEKATAGIRQVLSEFTAWAASQKGRAE